MSFHGAVAAPGCSENNPVAKKRRRWSTAHQEPALAPNRFGMKKHLKTPGRHHPSSNSLNSLASFHSKSNPIFEPSEEPSHSSSNNNNKPHAELQWYNNPSGEATLPNPLDGNSSRGGGGGGIELSRPQSIPKPKSRLGKVISPESSVLSNHSAAAGGGGVWREEEGEEEEKEEDKGIGDPILLMHSPAINGKSKRAKGLEQLRESSSRIEYSEGEWPMEEGEEEEEVPNERENSSALALTSSEDGARSTDGSSSRCLIVDGSDREEMLSSLEACERRSRELVEKAQANAAADLSQLRAYRAVIEQLRADCTKHEAAAKEWSDMHRDAVAQLVSARADITELDRQRGLQAVAIEDFKQKQGIDKDLQDAVSISDKLKLETLEKEQHDWRQKVESLEMELMATRSELSAAALRGEIREAEAEAETKAKARADAEAEHNVASQGLETKNADEEMEGEAGDKGEIEDGSNNSTTLSAKKLSEVELQLATACQQLEQLHRERNELSIAVQDAERRAQDAQTERDTVLLAVQDAEKRAQDAQTERDTVMLAVQDAEERAQDAQTERDTVVLAVQQEWDAVKVALREDKEKLEQKLDVVREQNARLQNELDKKARILEQGQRQESRTPEVGREKSLQVFIGDKVVEPGTERGDSLIALWTEYQKLEIELSEAFDHNKKQRSDREALNVALVGVRDGNRRLEGELGALQAEKTKLEVELSKAFDHNKKQKSDREALNVALDGVRDGNKKLQGEREALHVALVGVRDGNRKLGGELGALQAEKTKLEVELSEAFEHNKKQKRDREALNVALDGVREGNRKLQGEREALNAALVGVRDGNRTLEGEIGALQTEKTKLEREREALMTAVQEERQKLENERAVVCQAMRGENEKLESERDVLIAMQEYLRKLEMKKELAQPVGGDEKRRRKGKRGAATEN